MTDLDEIREASRYGYTRSAPAIVDLVLEAGWSDDASLIESYRRLSVHSDEYCAALLFQLPWRVRLPAIWGQLEDRSDEPWALFVQPRPASHGQVLRLSR